MCASWYRGKHGSLCIYKPKTNIQEVDKEKEDQPKQQNYLSYDIKEKTYI